MAIGVLAVQAATGTGLFSKSEPAGLVVPVNPSYSLQNVVVEFDVVRESSEAGLLETGLVSVGYEFAENSFVSARLERRVAETSAEYL